MKTKNIIKCIICLSLSLFIVLSFSSCTEPPRPDYETLSERMGKISENYAFEYFDMFIYNNAYQIYFNLKKENDVLLSLHTGENGYINSVTVTSYKKNMTDDASKNALLEFISAVVSSYTSISSSDSEKLKQNIRCFDTSKYFTDIYENYTVSRYNFTFSSNSEFVFLYCEYFDMTESSTET